MYCIPCTVNGSMRSEQSQTLKETLRQARPPAPQGWDAMNFLVPLSHTQCSGHTVLGRLVKVCLLPLRSLSYGSGQIGSGKCNHSANSSPVLGARGVGPPGSDTKALCLSRKQHQNASAVWVSAGRYFLCPSVCKCRGLFRGRGPGFWSHLLLILSKRW